MELSHIQEMRRPKNLVENRTSFVGPESVVSVYDTYLPESLVRLDADQLMYCGMVSGKKVMHSPLMSDQVFLPHESYVLAPGEAVHIDFPEAEIGNPTTCLTVEISREKVLDVTERLFDKGAIKLSSEDTWSKSGAVLHTHHCAATQRLLARIVNLFTENHPDRDMLIDFNISELLIRMLRDQERGFLLSHSLQTPDYSSLTVALKWIRDHLSEPLDIDKLCRESCMSRSRLYAEFKLRLDCSPMELQQQIRLKEAGKRLKRGEVITNICYDLGFSSPSHFCRRFKNMYGCTPTEYKSKLLSQF
ncbi:helix-turn-helix domain-containing protein [Leucothrix mucor]|uniref:helix-turn-helix domain-containing protein n=1 Tax=Leucothrix mucor TaxID=45248 RepID=UPI0003B5ED67|nr:helix-turn-helix domain-containing protein [Leucothrix mucor]